MVLRMPSNRTLAKIAVYGAIASVSAVMLMRIKIENNIRNQDYFKGALKTLRANQGAVRLLGEPIKENGIDISDDKKAFCNGSEAHMEVKLKGSKDKGTLFFWSVRSDNVWTLKRMELEIKTQPDKRFIIVKSTEDSDNVE